MRLQSAGVECDDRSMNAVRLGSWLSSLSCMAVLACSSDGSERNGSAGTTSGGGGTPSSQTTPGGGAQATAVGGSLPTTVGSQGGGAGTVGGEQAGASGAIVAVCSGAKPGPDNTGVRSGTVLTPSGSIKVEKRGAVIENLDITGEVTILADDVTLRNVRIRSGDYYPIRYFDNDNTGLLVEDSEIEGTSDDVTAGLSFANYTARRLNVHGSADGFKADENVLIEDCWIHDLRNGPGQHNDGVQSTGGKGVTIRHNSISGASNACVQTGDEGAATEDLTVECNWLSGGGYSLNIRGTGATRPKNTKILDNRFARDAAYGPWTVHDPSPEVVGNTYLDGTPIPYE
ncbi:MAG TPA: right-handed parallel beta-helix repeat-containing protein [Polyangiaceae bacterium]